MRDFHVKREENYIRLPIVHFHSEALDVNPLMAERIEQR